MYKLEYDDDGCLMMVKIEEVCLFSPKSIDGMIARLRSLRDKAWHDWPADRHNRKALEVVIRHGGVKGLFAAGALEMEEPQHQPTTHKPQRRKRGRPALGAGGRAS